MKPLTRALPSSSSSSSRICASCRRTLTSTSAKRLNDSLLSLDTSSTPQAPSSTSKSAAPASAPPSPTQSITQTLRRTMLAQQAREAARPTPQPEKKPVNDTLAPLLSNMDTREAFMSLEAQMPRRWRTGDVYSTHDLGPREAQKWSQVQHRPTRDVFEMLGQDPIRHYKNMPLLSQFVTETGRIKHSKLTGLKPKNQRKVAKAIRRAIGSGLMPSVHKHPELIARSLGIEDHLLRR